jgi:hypothetical protein
MNKEFKKKKYLIIKKAISKDVAGFCANYLSLKRQVSFTLFANKYLSPFEVMHGRWDDEQVPETFSIYGDVAMEVLLSKLHQPMETYTGLELYPNYAYARIYKRGDILHRHKDRFSCEISTTLNLGGDDWPIYLEPSGKEGMKGVKVDLKPGDMLVYQGNKLEHWREPFAGEHCFQVFLHYNNKKTPNAKENIYDGRIHLGLPSDFKKK